MKRTWYVVKVQGRAIGGDDFVSATIFATPEPQKKLLPAPCNIHNPPPVETEVQALLRGAFELLGGGRYWIKGILRSRVGNHYAFCSVGALHAKMWGVASVWHSPFNGVVMDAIDALKIGADCGCPIEGYNDAFSTTWADIERMWEKAYLAAA